MRKFTEIVTDLVAELVMLLLRHNYRLREASFIYCFCLGNVSAID